MKKKNAILYSRKDALWISVETIRFNLYESYKIALSEEIIETFSYTKDMTYAEMSELANIIIADKYERIIFIDDFPTPNNLLKFLFSKNDDQNIEILIHVYGSFLLRSSDWYALNEILIGKNVKLIVSSDSHKKLVDFFLDKKNETNICFSPLMVDDYYYSQELRDKKREELGFAEDDLVFLYSGRLSLQKNILLMLRELIHLKSQAGQKIKILLAGNFDDHGAPFFNINTPSGYYFQHYNQLISELSDDEKESIVYLKYIDSDELLKVMNASDIYINLSTFHCENYGIAPLEALSTGLPSILTAWGGFNSFFKKNGYCKLVEVKLDKSGLNINTEELKRHIENFSNMIITPENRKELSNIYTSEYSIDEAAIKIRKILDIEEQLFLGFGFKLKIMIKALSIGLEMPSSESFYSDVFSSYLKES